MSREITLHKKPDGLNDVLTVRAIGAPGAGGAPITYEIGYPLPDKDAAAASDKPRAARASFGLPITFQSGPPADGVNGVSMEALLAIVADRLECFQAGPFPSEGNANALTHVRSALGYMLQRTQERAARGVQGQAVQ